MSESGQKLRLGALIALVVGSMIGGGIFSLPQNMAARTDVGAVLIGWGITAVGMLASIPMAVIPQPIRTAPTSALAAMFCGSEKIPPPIIEPTTSATRAPSRSFPGASDIE